VVISSINLFLSSIFPQTESFINKYSIVYYMETNKNLSILYKAIEELNRQEEGSSCETQELVALNSEEDFTQWVTSSLMWLEHKEAEENVKNILISLPLVRC